MLSCVFRSSLIRSGPTFYDRRVTDGGTGNIMQCRDRPCRPYRVGQKISFWFQANMSIKLWRQEECEQIRTSTEKKEHCLIFSREIFLRHNCSMFKYFLTESSRWNYCQANKNSLRRPKHNVIKVCSTEYLTPHNRISVANFQVLEHSQYYRIFIPAKARDYVFTGVGLSVCLPVCLSVCLSVCYHDN